MTPRPVPLLDSLPTTAFAFRGYDRTNLGRTPELLAHPVYGRVVEAALREGSEVCESVIGRPVDLVGRVRRARSWSASPPMPKMWPSSRASAWPRFAFWSNGSRSRSRRWLAFGYSLGEAAALVAAGVFALKDLLRVPLAFAVDCVELASDVTMGVLFSRGRVLELAAVQRLCLEINQQGGGVIGVSSVLSPNCFLLLGQRGTIDQFAAKMKERLGGPITLRKNPYRWPPLHTSITWQRSIPNRAAVLLQTLPGGLTAPSLPILSSVTGHSSYTADNARELLHMWVDHPQQLWSQILGALTAGVKTIIHVGPAPNLIPATFKRLSEDVHGQLAGHSARSFGRASCRDWCIVPGCRNSCRRMPCCCGPPLCST